MVWTVRKYAQQPKFPKIQKLSLAKADTAERPFRCPDGLRRTTAHLTKRRRPPSFSTADPLPATAVLLPPSSLNFVGLSVWHRRDTAFYARTYPCKQISIFRLDSSLRSPPTLSL